MKRTSNTFYELKERVNRNFCVSRFSHEYSFLLINPQIAINEKNWSHNNFSTAINWVDPSNNCFWRWEFCYINSLGILLFNLHTICGCRIKFLARTFGCVISLFLYFISLLTKITSEFWCVTLLIMRYIEYLIEIISIISTFQFHFQNCFVGHQF